MLLQSDLDTADRIRQDAAQQADRIRSRRELTDAAKQARLAKVHQAAAQQMRQLQQNAAQFAKAQRSEAEQRAFGVSSLEGDSASIAISYRDAMDRAAQATTPKDAMALMLRANRSGDEALARATASHAFDMAVTGAGTLDPGWGEVVGAFVDQRPHLSGDVQALTQLAKPVNNAAELFAFVLPAPSELSGLGESRIAALAESDAA